MHPFLIHSIRCLKMFKIHDFITARDRSTAVPINEQQGALFMLKLQSV